MMDISEKQTIEYLVNGLKKSSSAAQQLALLNKKNDWYKIVRMLDQLRFNTKKLYEGKPQTRMQTLALADQIQREATKKTLN